MFTYPENCLGTWGRKSFTGKRGPCSPLKKRQQPCTIAFAVVVDVGQNPQIQIASGQPLVTPEYNVLFARVYDIDPAIPIEAGVVPFHWEGEQDVLLNNGENILLLARSECPFFEYHYSGTFNFEQ